MGFERWDIVKVPFPYTDRPVRERRPAVVVAAGRLAEDHGLLWVLMVTSAANRGWPDDVTIPQKPTTGLPVPSLVRTVKIATIETKEAERIGWLPEPARAEVERRLDALLGDPADER